MRVAATVLLWLLTTAALAATVPTAWAQHNIVDADGYAGLAQRAAADPALRAAAASELSSKATALISQRGYRMDPQLVRGGRHRLHRRPGLPAAVRTGQPGGAPMALQQRPVRP